MKPGTAKVKGRETENAAVEWLREKGWPDAERRRLTGSHDQGDITGISDVCIEVKSAAQWKPTQWLGELEVEMENAGASVGFVMARPKGKPNVDDWVIMITPEQLLWFLRASGYGPF